ncbi:outer membrane-stress sensor serine endopeptidase DegS [Vibrio sp. vnigr-6D03]|uniref:outer membrane-stress sensor serine endopeptidase DegS n=1 Tax=Vibrio TaxID=662 RepID=UPI000C33F47A|nr:MULTISPECIES: outer membrane-stress sensor serine endopeptidase DegS [Vibrio]MDP2573820.1 outer membrane-stress sensor serine endopeptidase DegS [Vibrio penaeicida]PKF79224.1 outer membrane-stress sensor serine endopeptidase DegS [Vibrio sp. vnigr-6D03]
MWKTLLRSSFIGLLTAGLLLAVLPSLRTAAVEATIDDTPTNIEDLQVSFSHAVRRASPAVVNIYTSKPNDGDRAGIKQDLGSGVIVSKKGYIITNYHVIAQAAEITVALQDGRYFSAQLVGKDRRTDIAVLRIEGANLPVIPLNPNYQEKVGDVVLAIGNPYNLGQTTTFGIISAIERFAISADGRQPFIQTDAAINKGNSGGALVNTKGELVGINTASFQQATNTNTYGISFAIPYFLADRVMEKIIADGRVIRGYIGISGQDITSISSRILGAEYVGGIIVMSVDVGGPAEDAGIRVKDIILEIGGAKVNGKEGVLEIVTGLRPGAEVEMTVLRKGEKVKLNVLVGDDPQG